MTPDLYRLSLRALWAIPSILNTVDLAAVLDAARRVGSEPDIQLVESLIALKARLPERP